VSQMKKRKAARKAKKAARKAKGVMALKKRRAARKKAASAVARGHVSPASRQIIKSTASVLSLALTRLADR